MNKTGASKPEAAKSGQQFWGSRLKEPPDALNLSYCAGRDVAERPMADEVLVPFDCWQNRAHTTMLAEMGIIDKKTAARICKSVTEFENQIKSGNLKLNPAKEDVHTNIEHYVADKLGAEISGVMHTGRSRNDQTTTVTRMYYRDRLLRLGGGVADLCDAILDKAAEYLEVPIAGFTHYQPGSIISVGHWLTSYAQALSRDLERIQSSYNRLNISPLGAAASFGTSWPIDRELTAKMLGFSEVQRNSLDCITNRWEMEAEAANAVSFVMAHLSIISQDLILLSSPQFGIYHIADRYVTGSSIMPQKRNPDFAEVTRAKAAAIQGMAASLGGIAKGALSGYNRDTQWTKYLIMDIFAEAEHAPAVFAGVFRTMQVNREAAEASARENFVNAVDVADVTAQESGLPFRTAYDIASKAVKLSEGRGAVDLDVVRKLAAEAGCKKLNLDVGDPKQINIRKAHTGGPAPLAVKKDIAHIRRTTVKIRQFTSNELQRLDHLRAALM